MSDQQELQEANDHQSSSSGSGSGSVSEASGIIQQMQNLVDVESGLAEAYVAVETAGAGNVDEIPVNDEEEDAGATANDTMGFMQAATKVEEALESAIPPAPPAASALPGFGSASTPDQVQQSTSTSTAATEAQQAIDAVNADISVPILPKQVAEPIHDVAMETAVEEETSPMQVDMDGENVRPRYDPSEPQTTYDPSEPQTTYDPSEPQTTYDPSEPQTTYDPSEPQVSYDPSEPQGQDDTRASYDPSEPQQVEPEQASSERQAVVSPQKQTFGQQGSSDHYAPLAAAVDPRQQSNPVKQENASNNSTPIQQNALPPAPAPAPAPAPVPTLAPIPTGRPLCDLPADITEESPSVVSNRELVNLWRSSESPLPSVKCSLLLDPSNTHALLGLFDWSIQRSEAADARAWYAVIAKDDPSAVSLDSPQRKTESLTPPGPTAAFTH
jgi:hypothetical protein